MVDIVDVDNVEHIVDDEDCNGWLMPVAVVVVVIVVVVVAADETIDDDDKFGCIG